MIETITYQTIGTCSKQIIVEVEDNIIKNVVFIGGCNGNLKGIAKLVEGSEINEVIKRLKGITCGPKPTSCPDQLAQCLAQYAKEKENATLIN